ncbi:hypothetical protein BL250_15140 [Erwinia sp. OLTSP20]|nr:hypothetical protein BV501_16955 [Erwinia sp. OAMSP11]PIJ75978.1 hypothetical protein BK416_00360 [Erwinia sp. OLSSP12]PIJ78878.1 hypothetical protein BLD47_16305 [Erwinia sp. OLCASP19]PIJ87432.1 hypothetical protein BLD46_00350 [Erwinia sp. OLMTSP26]PIJ88982.1 hypothetical protein BLD49_00350 [Erwinia sp. OLMDSP33]PIJ89705.1 hypothetical protein BL250_15140 [Erwinia sp. OLTSP20]PIJ94204.1 hypothetical protein BL249_02690 [Erwinia sp. OLFS4]
MSLTHAQVTIFYDVIFVSNLIIVFLVMFLNLQLIYFLWHNSLELNKYCQGTVRLFVDIEDVKSIAGKNKVFTGK